MTYQKNLVLKYKINLLTKWLNSIEVNLNLEN